MIKILIVDDSTTKTNSIRDFVLSCSSVTDEYVEVVDCVKEARRAMYKTKFHLVILDLLIPVESNSDPTPKNSISFLNEMKINPSIKFPIHIIGTTVHDETNLWTKEFAKNAWLLVTYNETDNYWQESMMPIIYHLQEIEKYITNRTISSSYAQIEKQLNELPIDNTFIGLSWKEIAVSLAKIVSRSFDVPSTFKNGSKAKNINIHTIKFESEYDVQNYINIVLKPWLPSLEAENIAIVIGGNTKNADFSINQNSVIVEVKYIDKNEKKNGVTKTLDGLSSFYAKNANVKCVLFIIYVTSNVTIDVHQMESMYTQTIGPIIVHTSVLKM